MKPCYLFILAVILTFNQAHSQIEVENLLESTNTPEYYIEELLLGEGIEAFNIQFHGDSAQLGEFWNGENSNLDMNYGLIMGTSNVHIADTFPNVSVQFQPPLTNPLPMDYDSALSALSAQGTFETVVLEFDFVPTGDSVKFNYIFASEEYNNYVCTQFNDIFGFFLSGPGITGVANLALVPGSNDLVAVNNINDGKASFGNAPQACSYNGNNCACNSQYYVNNNYPNIGDSVQYNGFTVPLVARHEVICGDTYHIRMALADVGDGSFDSGVFLEGGSFASDLIEVNIATVNGDSTINEGCGEASIVFSRGDTTDTSISYLFFSGTATNGVDFDLIPDTIILFPGDEDTTITIIPYADGLNEGIEHFLISAVSVTECGDTFTSQGTLYIYDTAQLNLLVPPDTFLSCPPDSLVFWVQVLNGGPPPFKYLWNNGDTTDTAVFHTSPNGGIDTFIVSVQDSCLIKTFYDTILITKNYANDPLPDILNDSLVNCAGDSVKLICDVLFGSQPLKFAWSTGDTISNTVVTVNGPQTIVVTVTDDCGRIVTDTAFLGVKEPAQFNIQFPDTFQYCQGSELLVNPLYSGGVRPFSYSWDMTNPIFDDDSIFELTLHQDTTLFFWVQDACGRTFDTRFYLDALITDTLRGHLEDQSAQCGGTTFSLNPGVAGGMEPLSYQWSTGDTVPAINIITSVTQSIGLTVTDFCNNMLDISASIEVSEFEPMNISISGDAELCYGEEYFIHVRASGGAGGYEFEWIPAKDRKTGESFEKTDSTTFRIISKQNNVHTIRVTDDCGVVLSDTVHIIVDPCVSIPNVISPNGDGVNDAFYINNITHFDDAHLFIYNRWGQKVFESLPYRNEWVPVDHTSGVYYYILRSSNFSELRGNVTLINEND